MTIEEVHAMVVELKKQLYEEKEEASKKELRRIQALTSHLVVGMSALAIGLAIGSCHFVIKP